MPCSERIATTLQPVFSRIEDSAAVDGLVEQWLGAKEAELDTSLAGLPHHEVYGQMLEVEHLERTIRSRSSARAPPGPAHRARADLSGRRAPHHVDGER